MRRIEASLSQDRKDCHPIFGRAEKVVSWSFSLQDWKQLRRICKLDMGKVTITRWNCNIPQDVLYILQIWCTGPRGLLGQTLCRYDLYTASGGAGGFDVVICDAKIVAQIGVVVTLSWYDMICIFNIIYIVSLYVFLLFVSIIIYIHFHTL